MSKQTINQQILVWMLSVAILPIFLLTAFYLYSYDQHFKQQVFAQLSQIADKKTNQIEDLISERIKVAQLAAQLDSTKNALKELSSEFKQRDHNEIEYLQRQEVYSELLQQFLEFGFYDIFLISSEADIVLTLSHKDELYKNLNNGLYAKTDLAIMANKALSLQEPALSNFNYYASRDELAAFIALPVLEQGIILGVIVFQLDIDELQRIVQDTGGLGASGEVHIVAVNQPHFEYSIDVSNKSHWQAQPFQFGEVMQQALTGHSNQHFAIDRYGHKVLAVSRYLPLLHSVFVVKMDRDEALKELNMFWLVSLLVMLLIFVMVAGVAYFLSQSVTRPIRALTRLSSAIAHGQHAQELVPEGSLETMQLASSFNLMMRQMQDEQSRLERRVKQRTAELSQKEQHLRLYREQSPIATIEWDIQGQVVYWNKAAEKVFAYTFAEVKGKSFWGLLIPESEQGKVRDVWQGLMSQSGGEFSINDNLTKGGKVITCEWHNTVLVNESGVVGVASLVLDITERQRMAAVLQTLAESKGQGEENIFQLIVRQLALSQGVRYALLARFNAANPEISDTLAVWANGVFMDNFSYPLQGTPCQNVSIQGACLYTDNIQALFPDDKLLVDMQAVSYFGVPLNSISGEKLGILALLDDKPMEQQQSTKKLLASLAVRAAAELERKQVEEKLQFAARIFDQTHEGVTITDANAVIIDVNPGFCRITGYSRDEVIGKSTRILNSGRQSEAFYREMWQTLSEKGHWQGELWNRKKNGQVYAELITISSLLDDECKVMNYVGLFSDITLAKQQQQSLELMAHYDVLTGLPNRSLFTDRFAQAIAHSKREQSLLAVCFIDLDKFKPVNDTYGHDVGDQVLIEVGERIKGVIRAEDTVSRLGGDEFTLLLGDVHSIEQCTQAMMRIHQMIARPYIIEGHSVTIEASSGLTIYPLDDADPDTLIRHADSAMYQAKLAGRNCYHLFDASSDEKVIKRHSQLTKIAHAFSRNEFCLYYQPKINMQTGQVFGVEALIRWLHPQEGLIPPLDFLPFIEGTELEIQVGNWVIDEALKQLAIWREAGLSLQVSVNISALHLLWQGFFRQVYSALAEHPEISSRYLQLEILESSVLSDVTLISGIIKSCRNDLGIGIALDDFGTGYSSLTHLRRIPVDTIKIDQSFVRDMLDDPSDYAIVEGVIGLSKAFQRRVIAEGVETREHGRVLIEMGCFQGQGYGIARPMPAEQVETWTTDFQLSADWQE